MINFRQIETIEDVKFNKNFIYIIISNRNIYKLHKINNKYSFIDLDSTNCHANGFNSDVNKTISDMLFKNYPFYEFKKQDDMLLFLGKLVTNHQWKTTFHKINTDNW